MKEKLWLWLDKVMDIILLSLVILIFSLPVITMLASFSAGIQVFRYKQTGQVSDNVFRLFFISFKAVFFKGLIGELVLGLFYYIGMVNIEIARTAGQSMSIFIYSITAFFMLVITLTAINYMIVMPDKERSMKVMLRNSLIMTFVKFPYSFTISICYVALVLSIIIFPPIMIVTIGTVSFIHQRFGKKIWNATGQALIAP
ncbi:DUF624 domain-containing protein [Neobacillus sp. NPDC097160]|uniref:DUF624 domain-containing protein n=1 Tax=Neobacillus sp. NPDC097160 TaxID=3364298 RepID=UPI00381A6EB4